VLFQVATSTLGQALITQQEIAQRCAALAALLTSILPLDPDHTLLQRPQDAAGLQAAAPSSASSMEGAAHTSGHSRGLNEGQEAGGEPGCASLPRQVMEGPDPEKQLEDAVDCTPLDTFFRCAHTASAALQAGVFSLHSLLWRMSRLV
jgi:hypothetical protein